MTSQGQMALRRRAGRPWVRARWVVMGPQCTRALPAQQWRGGRLANAGWTVA